MYPEPVEAGDEAEEGVAEGVVGAASPTGTAATETEWQSSLVTGGVPR